MSTPTDTLPGTTEEDPSEQPQGKPSSSTTLPGESWTDENGIVHNHDVHTDCGAGCPRSATV